MAAFCFNVNSHHSFEIALVLVRLDHVAKLYVRLFGSIRLLPINKSGVFPDCHRAGRSFRTIEDFHDCSGGNSRPSHLSGVGGGNFLIPTPNSATSLKTITSLKRARITRRAFPR